MAGVTAWVEPRLAEGNNVKIVANSFLISSIFSGVRILRIFVWEIDKSFHEEGPGLGWMSPDWASSALIIMCKDKLENVTTLWHRTMRTWGELENETSLGLRTLYSIRSVAILDTKPSSPEWSPWTPSPTSTTHPAIPHHAASKQRLIKIKWVISVLLGRN